MESDWKKFRAIVPMLRERFIAERNTLIAAMLADPKKTETERFWDALEKMEKEAKTLRRCLDGHTRSNMWLHMMSMRAAGMLKKADLADFSEELQKQVFDETFQK
jgi:hypothetical protein